MFDSSPWAERGFCKTCGTHLFYLLKDAEGFQTPVGLFGDAVAPAFGLQVFIDSARLLEAEGRRRGGVTSR